MAKIAAHKLLQVKASLLTLLLAVFSAHAETAGPLTIGAIVPLTGPYANFGEAARVGLQLGFEKSGNSKVKVIYEDSQFDAVKAVAAFNKLVNVDRVDVLFVLGTPPASAILPLAEKRNLPLFAWSASSRISKGHPTVLRLMSSGAVQGAEISKYAKLKNYTRVAHFIAQNEFAQTIRDGFVENFGRSSITMDEEILPSEMDFRTHLTRARATGATALGICLNTGQIPAFITQAHSLGLDLPIFGCTSMSNPDVQKALQATGSRAWFVEGTMAPEFEKDFKSRLSDPSAIWEAAGFYDAALLISSAAETKDLIATLRGRCLKGAFPESCVRYVEEDTYLDYQLRVTWMNGEEFLRE